MIRLPGKTIIHILIIALIGFLIYSSALYTPFYFDDRPNIVENRDLKDLKNFWPPKGSRWFGFLTLAVNYQCAGLDTLGYHIVNITVHIFNSILVYYLVMLTFKTPFFRRQGGSMESGLHPAPSAPRAENNELRDVRHIALFSGLLFVSHPIQTQSVTYIVQRFTSLATFFYLLSLAAYIKFRIHDSRSAIQNKNIVNRASCIMYLASLFPAVLAMKTKEIAFTLPFIIILYELSFLGKPDSALSGLARYKRFVLLIPYLLTLIIIPLSMHGSGKPVGDIIGELRDASQETSEIPRLNYLFTQFRVLVTYIRLFFLPVNQNLDYDYHIYKSFFEPSVFLSFLFLLSISGLAVYLFYATRYTLHAARLISFGIFWFFITLSVESSIIPIRDVIFEHRLYLPSAGVFISLATLAFGLAAKDRIKRIKPNIAAVILFGMITLIFAGASYMRNMIWQNELSLWSDVVEKSPNKTRANLNLGLAYQNIGKFDKALDIYNRTIRLDPFYSFPYNNRGAIYYLLGDYKKALDDYSMFIMINPKSSEVYHNRGAIYFNMLEYDRALEDFTKAIALNPYYADAYNNRGAVYAGKGQIEKAIGDFTKAVALAPEFAGYYLNRGRAYSAGRQYENAIKDFDKAILLNPDNAGAYYQRGSAFSAIGQRKDAAADFNRACIMGKKEGCEAKY